MLRPRDPRPLRRAGGQPLARWSPGLSLPPGTGTCPLRTGLVGSGGECGPRPIFANRGTLPPYSFSRCAWEARRPDRPGGRARRRSDGTRSHSSTATPIRRPPGGRRHARPMLAQRPVSSTAEPDRPVRFGSDHDARSTYRQPRPNGSTKERQPRLHRRIARDPAGDRGGPGRRGDRRLPGLRLRPRPGEPRHRRHPAVEAVVRGQPSGTAASTAPPTTRSTSGGSTR